MMDNTLYEMIFKRKSYHLFRDNKTRRGYNLDFHITDEEYADIYRAFSGFERLYPDIAIDMRIEDNELTSCARHQEKVILLYSEIKDNYLMNIGYVGEQLDLYLASKNIGSLWFGLNNKKMPDHNGLKYVIMIAIGKVPEESFRKNMFKAKRKDLSQIWQGDMLPGISDIIRFAPSACNSQPWKVIKDDGTVKVYRYVDLIRKWVMPLHGLLHYNHIDIGIFLCFLELCLEHNDISFERKLYVDDRNDEMNLVAEYELERS